MWKDGPLAALSPAVPESKPPRAFLLVKKFVSTNLLAQDVVARLVAVVARGMNHTAMQTLDEFLQEPLGEKIAAGQVASAIDRIVLMQQFLLRYRTSMYRPT